MLKFHSWKTVAGNSGPAATSCSAACLGAGALLRAINGSRKGGKPYGKHQHRKSEHGKKHGQLRQRQYSAVEGRGARSSAPCGYFRLRRFGRLRARRLRDPVELGRRGAPGIWQPYHAHRFRRRLHSGGGQWPRLPAGLEPHRKALQLGTGVLRAVRRRQIQQQRRRRLRLLVGHERPGLVRHAIRFRIHGRHRVARRQQVSAALQEGQGRWREEKGAAG